MSVSDICSLLSASIAVFKLFCLNSASFVFFSSPASSCADGHAHKYWYGTVLTPEFAAIVSTAVASPTSRDRTSDSEFFKLKHSDLHLPLYAPHCSASYAAGATVSRLQLQRAVTFLKSCCDNNKVFISEAEST